MNIGPIKNVPLPKKNLNDALGVELCLKYSLFKMKIAKDRHLFYTHFMRIDEHVLDID